MVFSKILGDKLKHLFYEIRLGKRGEATRGKEDLDILKFEILKCALSNKKQLHQLLFYLQHLCFLFHL